MPVSEAYILSWRCPSCQHRSWLHYEHCQRCGEARPKPVETEPAHTGKPEPFNAA